MGVGDKKLMSVCLVVFIVRGHLSKGIILIESVELDPFNNTLMYINMEELTMRLEEVM